MNEEPRHLSSIDFDEIGCPRLSGKWTLQERLAAVAFLASVIENDIVSGQYSTSGRPDSNFIQYVCAASAEDLEAHGIREAISGYAREICTQINLRQRRDSSVFRVGSR